MKQGYKGTISFLSFIVFLLFTPSLKAQVFWSEDFQTGCNRGNLASSYTSANGSWSITATGTNDNFANQWFVSATEAGVGTGNCGDGCITNSTLDNRTLHISNITIPTFFQADSGALYHPGGTCAFMVCVATDRRAESPTINCSGQSNITLSFKYMEGGNANDHAMLYLFDGTSWNLLDSLTKTAVCSNGAGTWTSFSTVLPASANNNANVKLGFRWINNDDGVGTAPSFAVDDIELSVATAPPVVGFSVSDSTICEGGCISFTDTSSNMPTSWSWSFPGANPATSTAQHPTNICYSTAGVYPVKLVATNTNGSDSLEKTGYITVSACGPPVASFFASDSVICQMQCISFSDSSLGNPISWQWTFQNAAPPTSNAQHPSNICFGVPGIQNVQLVVDNGTSTDTLIKTINVLSCATPVGNFQSTDSTLCVGDAIDFTDLSLGNPDTWQWSFPGATPSSSFAQNPTGITYTTPGVYDVTLIVSNSLGNDTVVKVGFITVENCVPPAASFTASNTNFCANTCINFTDLSSNNPTTWEWSFPGGTPSASNLQNPTGICYNTPGTYDVTLIVTNAFGSDTGKVTGYITVNECEPPVVGFFADSTIICAGSCLNFQDTSLHGPTSWSWTFQGSLTPASNAQHPFNICYPTAGLYPVSLIATNSLGSATEIRTNYIEVVDCVPPVALYDLDGPICQGTCHRPENLSVGAEGYQWIAPKAVPPLTTDSTPFFCFPDTGDHYIQLIAYNEWGADTFELYFRVDTMPKVTVDNDTIVINLGDNATLGATTPPGGSFWWTPKGSLDCDTCDNPIAHPLLSTPYVIHYLDSNGCIGTDTTWVEVIEQNIAIVPDAFSPNGDGENDMLFVRGHDINQINFRVYDRYGHLMFESDRLDRGWDGRHNGYPVNAGVYFWYFDVIFDNGAQLTDKGRIVLIR